MALEVSPVSLYMKPFIKRGATYTGKVVEILPIGCRVEIVPGYLGFVHVRDLEYKRTENVEDVVKMGDTVTIKCLGTDEKGRMNFSRKAALTRKPFKAEREEGEKEDTAETETKED